MMKNNGGALRAPFSVTLDADSPLACAFLPCPLRELEPLLAMGVPGPTNILSFPGEPLTGLAELVLSSETLCRECVLYGQEPLRHLVRLTAHGFGHVCGFDHGPFMDAFTGRLGAAAEEWIGKQGGCRV